MAITWYHGGYSTGTLNVTGVAWNNGDTVVVFGGTSAQATTINTPTNANLTFTLDTSANAVDNCRSYVWEEVATSTETSQTISATRAAGGDSFTLSVAVSDTALRATTPTGADTTNSGPSITGESGGTIACAVYDWNASTGGIGGGAVVSGTTRDDSRDDLNSGQFATYAGDWEDTPATSQTYGLASYSGLDCSNGWAVFQSGLTSDQEGFRFRADSGNEATPTWLAAQDTVITGRAAETTTGVRVLIDYTGDPPSEAPKLQYRLVGDADSEWEDLA